MLKNNFLIFLFFLIFLSSQIFAQDFSVKELIIKDSNGQAFDLKDHKGKVVLVNFWVSWCGNCKVEMTILHDLYLKYHKQGLEIVGISIDEARSRSNFKRVAHHLNFPNFMAIDAIKNDFGMPNNVPQDYLIDRAGRVFLIDDPLELEAKIEYLLR